MEFKQLAQQFYLRTQNQPEKPALFVDKTIFSYGELLSFVAKMGKWLKNNHVKRLGIITTRTLSPYLGILAASWANAAYVPLNPKVPENRLLNILNSANLDAIIVDQASAAMITNILQNIPSPPLLLSPYQAIDNAEGVIHNPEALDTFININPPYEANESDICYLIFTSGTTGEPKGVPINLKNLSHFITAMQERFAFTPEDRFAQFPHLSFDQSVFSIMMSWCSGACLCVVPEEQMIAPGRFIREQNITVWRSVPSIIGFMQKLKMLEPNSFPSLRYSLFGGEALKVAYANWWQAAAPNSIIDNVFGPTEVTVTCLVHRFNEKDAESEKYQSVPIGLPLKGLNAEIIDEQQQFLPVDQSGELIVAGDQVVTGYWNNFELTASKFIFLQHKSLGLQLWYRTGDCCYRDENGCYHYIGRIDNQCKIQGFRVELEEIETFLAQAADCLNVAVIAIEDEIKMGTILVGILCHDNPEEFDLSAIKTKLKENLPFYMIPEKILVKSNFPYSINKKLDRKALTDWVYQELVKLPSLV